jgi:hypothetical protein
VTASGALHSTTSTKRFGLTNCLVENMVWTMFNTPPPGTTQAMDLVHKKSTDDTEEEDEEPLECDYDKDVTGLYQAMEEKAWLAALDFMKTGKWDDNILVSHDPITPRDQARTWVTRYEKSGKVRWSQLPLHAALIFKAPFLVVEALVKLYPKAIRCTDDQHMLPLHLAFRYGASDNTIALLLQHFPEAMRQKGHRDRLPLECAKIGPNPHRALIIESYLDDHKKEWRARAEKQVNQLQETLEQKERQVNELENHTKDLEMTKEEKEEQLTKTQEELEIAKAQAQAAEAAAIAASESNKSKKSTSPLVKKDSSSLKKEKKAVEKAATEKKEAEKKEAALTKAAVESAKPKTKPTTSSKGVEQPKRRGFFFFGRKPATKDSKTTVPTTETKKTSTVDVKKTSTVDTKKTSTTEIKKNSTAETKKSSTSAATTSSSSKKKEVTKTPAAARTKEEIKVETVISGSDGGADKVEMARSQEMNENEENFKELKEATQGITV